MERNPRDSAEVTFSDEDKNLYGLYKERFEHGATEEEIIEEAKKSNKTPKEVINEKVRANDYDAILKAWAGVPGDETQPGLITEEESKALLEEANKKESDKTALEPQTSYTPEEISRIGAPDSVPALEYAKQKSLYNNLQDLEKQQKEDILRVEQLLNQLTGSIPKDTNPELKEQFDKQFEELFSAHDTLLKKHDETKKQLELVDQNFQRVNDVVNKKQETTDKDQKQELQKQFDEFKADKIDVKPLEVPEIDYETPTNTLKQIPEKDRLNLQSPWSAVLEKREKLNQEKEKTESPKLEPQTPTIKEPASTPPAPAKEPSTPSGTSAPATPTLTPKQNETSQLQLEPLANFANITTNLFDATELNFKDSTPTEQAINFESSKPFNLDLKTDLNKTDTDFSFAKNQTENTFTPTPDLSETSPITTASTPNDEKLDKILGDTGMANNLLVKLIEALPSLMAGSAMNGMPAQSPTNQSVQIPVNQSNNKSRIEPSMPNIPGIRANLGLA